MNDKNKQTMYKLIRDLGDIRGIAQMTVITLNAFIESIRELKCTRDNFQELYIELAETIKKSQPNIVPIMHLLEFFETEMKKLVKPEMDIEEIRKLAIENLEEKVALFRRNASMVTKNGLKCIQNDDVIVVHSASTVVTNILTQAKIELNRQFKVIILDNNPARTRQTVQAMRDADIEHTVAPAHNFSHHVEKANKMFVGAMTVTSDHKIVAPTGTAGAVSLCYLNKIEIHLFANTLHFSSRGAMDQLIYEGLEDTTSANTNFSMTTHSHDLVSLELIDHIITEIGEVQQGGEIKKITP